MYQGYGQGPPPSFHPSFNNAPFATDERPPPPMNNPKPIGGRGGGFGGFSHKAPILATDMRCYFDCPEGFKKDYDLRLHIKLKHRNEDEEEIRKAWEAAEEEIALTSRSASIFQCAICPKKLNDIGAFYDHIRKKHELQWFEYKDKYGRCEVESAPFECNICGRIVKYIRDSINKHLKKCHNITWILYLDRIRKMRKGEEPPELPGTELFECKVCNASMKYSSKREHMKGVHQITELEYIQLSRNEYAKNEFKKSKPSESLPPPIPKDELPMDDEFSVNNEDIETEMLSKVGAVKTGDRNAQKKYSKSSQSLPFMDPKTNDEEYSNLPDLPQPVTPKKLEKKCNACNISFESIGLYIKHTTSVDHNKFKGSNMDNQVQSSFNSQRENLQHQFDKNNNIPDNQPEQGIKENYENLYQPNHRFGNQKPPETELDPRYDDPDYECEEEEIFENDSVNPYCEYDSEGYPLP